MLSKQEIRQALHAQRVVPLRVANPRGPLGLEHLAAAVQGLHQAALTQPPQSRVRRPIELSLTTWEKLRQMAVATSQATSTPVSPGELVTAIVEQYVATADS